ncbi:MAG: helicase-related protein, partial [Acidimicrobiia bacterium]|nr:helicase-related protein [Acidimicrobiia bacterium]
FSATLDGEVRALVREHQRSPVRHEAEGADGEPAQATHHFWLVDHHDRIDRTAEIVGDPTIVFTRTRHGADRLAKQLAKRGVEAVSMHGGRSQKQRTRALDAFSSGRARALVATDVAARGIHVDDVATVVHFDPPNDAKDYVHRSGRTARAGATGTVVSLVTPEQKRSVGRMRRDLGLDGPLDRPDPGGLHTADRPEPARPAERRTSIYVANLPWSTTAEELEAVFARTGQVFDATIITDRRGNRSRGFGFVEMSQTDAARAIDELAGTTLGGRDLTVREAHPRT